MTPILVALLTVGVFALRLSQLHQGLFGDELFTHQDVVNHDFLAMIRGVHTGAENSPPLFFMLAWLSAKLGDPTVLIRLPSLLLGTATIPLLFLLGRQVAMPKAGLLAATLFGFSPFFTYYGIEARPYASMVFFVVLSTWALLRAIRSERRGWWIVYALSAAAAAYCHYTSVFVLVVQGVWSLWVLRSRRRAPLLAGVAAAALYLPWISHVRGKTLSVIALLQPLNAHNVIQDLARVTGGYPYANIHQIPTVGAFGALVACALIGAGWWLARSGLSPDTSRFAGLNRLRPEQILLLLLTFATPIGLLLYSMLGTDLWLSRGLSASIPYGCLLLACALLAPPAPLRTMLVVVALGVYAFGTIRAISPAHQRPQYRQLADYLDRVAPAQDPVIADPIFVGPGISAELHRTHRMIAPSATQFRHTPRGGTAWDVIADAFLRSSPPGVPGFTLIARRHYGGVLPVTLFGFRRQ